MRIASLLSSATEIVYELGLGDHLVAISHECDSPPEALRLPRLSRSRFDPGGLSSAEIDAEVRRCMAEFGSVYQVDVERLREVRPDLILTQAVCEVCAVPTGSVREAVAQLSHQPRVLSLDAHTIGEIFGTIQQVADAAGESRCGTQATDRLRARMDRVEEAVVGRPRPRVLALEWLDPPFIPGHWVPEIIEAAGGETLLGSAGRRSEQVGWEAVEELDPDALLLLPCGYDLPQARADADGARSRLETVAGRAIRSGRAWIGHGSFFSRSGPRVVGGIEATARILHPERFATDTPGGIVDPWR